MSTLFLFFAFAMMLEVAVCYNFSELFQPMWAPDHIIVQGDRVLLTLDNTTGSGFVSKQKYLFGKASAQIKLVEGDSAGTVAAFYFISEGPFDVHDELDFEFLGNVSGEPYLLQTNVYINGTANREQRHNLWFDPTKDFHNYSFFWNHHFVLFEVDGIPIRVYENKEEKGVLYPNNKAMGIHCSLGNADEWATQGGMIKMNWSHSPFIATFGAFEVDACALPLSETDESSVAKCGKKGQFWWDHSANKKLDKNKKRQLESVQDKFLVYDYCKDIARFRSTEMPKECQV